MASEHRIPRPQKIKLPPVPPSQLPQNIPPTKLSKGLQFGSFAFAGGQSSSCVQGQRPKLTSRLRAVLTAYAVLVYDFGPREHCFMPVCSAFALFVSTIELQLNLCLLFIQIRRWFDAQTRDLFTLTPRDRQILDPRAGPLGEGVKPDRRTPIEFFKERGTEGVVDDGKRV